MTTFRQQFSGRIRNVAMGFIVGGLALCAAQAGAAPITSNCDDLIADLQGRAAALSNSTNKAEEKEFKTIEKVLSALNKSSSLATDIKNLGSAAKTLIKAFPTDYMPPGSSLLTNTETALDGLIDNVQTLIDTTETNASTLSASCAAKAKASVDAAQTQLDNASAPTSFPTAAKLLGMALKTELKAEAVVAKCAAESGGGGGGGTNTNDFVMATITGAFNNSFMSSVLPPVATVGDLGFLVTIGAGEPAFGGTAMDIVTMNVTGANTYPIQTDSDLYRTNPSNTFYVVDGELTYTTYDLTNRMLAGTFNYTATNSAQGGSITVTNGSFRFSHIQFVGGTP